MFEPRALPIKQLASTEKHAAVAEGVTIRPTREWLQLFHVPLRSIQGGRNEQRLVLKLRNSFRTMVVGIHPS